MKFLLAALLFASSPAFAATSACSVFIDNAPTNDSASFAVYAVCDGKQVSHLDYTDGVMAPITKVLQGLLAKGYALNTCSGTGGATQCFLTK